MPKLKSGVLSLNPVTGELGFDKAKHLLNRCLFGPRLAEIQFMQKKTAVDALDVLLNDAAVSLPPPLSGKTTDTEAPLGTTWVNIPYNSDFQSQRYYSYNSWWTGRIMNQELSLREKMTLFWHNHFVIEQDAVSNSNFNYQYSNLLWENALGNFKKLTSEITINTGMLYYLNGSENVAGAPNENYARELFELFTVGKGPLIAPGNYTNYSENDIREAAKVLTGWYASRTNNKAIFYSVKHDKTTKTFSEIFGGRRILNGEENEYKELVNMIFEQRETARFLVRKLYRWFVYHQIDSEIEAKLIEPLATLFIESNFEVKPVLKKLLASEHFFDTNLRGGNIKNPLEFTAGMLRQLEYIAPPADKLEAQYAMFYWLFGQARLQEMRLGSPPDVAGWPAWYLAPAYNQLWINGVTIPAKATFVKTIVLDGYRPISTYEKQYIDPFKVAWLAKTPSDINDLLGTITGLLWPMPASAAQIAKLKEVLIPGLPDFEWTVEWNKYINDPTNVNQKNAVAGALKNLIVKICTSAEYQLN
jgi:hypothetical protein